MKHLEACDEQTIDRLSRALRRCAVGKPVSFAIEEGMTRHLEEGKLIEVPNGTFTFRFYVNGGAKDAGEAPI